MFVIMEAFFHYKDILRFLFLPDQLKPGEPVPPQSLFLYTAHNDFRFIYGANKKMLFLRSKGIGGTKIAPFTLYNIKRKQRSWHMA